MPRNKVHPLDRKRVARACISCKRRKEKCDGERPCRNCKSQKRDHTCQYPTSQASTSPRSSRPLLQDENSPHNPNSEDILGLLDNAIDEYSQPGVSRGDSVTCTTSAPVPKVSRMLVGNNGRFSKCLHYLLEDTSNPLHSIYWRFCGIVIPTNHQTSRWRHCWYPAISLQIPYATK